MTADGQQLGLPIEDRQVGEVHTSTIRLGFLPPSKNVYDSWAPTWKSGAKKKWIRHIAQAVEEQAIPKGLRKVGLAARLVFPTNQRRDTQNYSQTLWHFVPDALVQAGVLVDDRVGMVEIGPNWGVEMVVDYRPAVPKAKRQRTIITLAYKITEGQCLACMRDQWGRCPEHRLHQTGSGDW